ncbi:conserved hypothetical protein [Paraburkholderia tropica]
MTKSVRVGPPTLIQAAPGTIAYSCVDGDEFIEPVIAYSVELMEHTDASGYVSYTHFTTILGIDGEINEYKAIVLPDGAMALEHSGLQTLAEYREARKLIRK